MASVELSTFKYSSRRSVALKATWPMGTVFLTVDCKFLTSLLIPCQRPAWLSLEHRWETFLTLHAMSLAGSALQANPSVSHLKGGLACTANAKLNPTPISRHHCYLERWGNRWVLGQLKKKCTQQLMSCHVRTWV